MQEKDSSKTNGIPMLFKEMTSRRIVVQVLKIRGMFVVAVVTVIINERGLIL